MDSSHLPGFRPSPRNCGAALEFDGDTPGTLARQAVRLPRRLRTDRPNLPEMDFTRTPPLKNGTASSSPQAAPLQAIRGAKAYLAAWLREAESRAPPACRQARSSCINGGGPGRGIERLFRGAPQSRVFVHYVDPGCQRAIAHAARLCASVTASISFRQGNPLSLGPRMSAPHYIWSFGLFDYLDHSNSVGLLQRVCGPQLPPGANSWRATFPPIRPQRPTSNSAGWAVHDRNAAQLAASGTRSGRPPVRNPDRAGARRSHSVSPSV